MEFAFVCPRCLWPSASDVDARYGYCGRCHSFTASQDILESMPAEDYYRWTRACRSYGVPAQRIRRLGQVPPEMPLTPRTLLEEPCWVYEGTEDGGQVAVFRFDPMSAPWTGCWRPEGLGWLDYRWEHGNTLHVRVRTEVVARAVMELIQLPGPLSRSWSWDELRERHEQARIAGYLALREGGYGSAEALARSFPPSALERLSAAAPEAAFRYQVEQLSAEFPEGSVVQLPPASLAGLAFTAEGLADLPPAIPAPDNGEGAWDEHWGDAMDWTAGMPEL